MQLTHITLASGAESLQAPVLRPRKLLCFGDSITEGVNTLSAPLGGGSLADSSADVSWALELGRLLGAEVGVVGFGGQGFTTNGGGGVPTFGDAWDWLWDGQARDFSDPPDWCVWNQGTNGVTIAAVAALNVLNPQLAAMPGTRFLLQRPFENELQGPALSTAAATCNDPGRVLYVDSDGWITAGDYSDGLHPYGYPLMAKVAPLLAAAALDGGTKAARTVTITLTSDGTTPIASATGLKWAWFDQARPQHFNSPASQGEVETTDGSGVLTITVQSSLAPGGVGWLTVTDSDGTTTQSPSHKAFSGPVAVS